MDFLIYPAILLSAIYLLFIIYLIYVWNQAPALKPEGEYALPFVSIIIAARNEEENILQCLESCLAQNYPSHLLEIIVVDDQSEDNTFELVEAIEDHRLVLMRLGVYKRTTIKGSKKKALAYGISHAKGEIICTTDADCLVPANWVKTISAYFTNPIIKFVSGPVKILEEKSWISIFQSLDFSGNGLVNAAGIQSKLFYLANAANLSYRKEIFLAQDAFEDNYHIASGDDVFLLDKIRRTFPDGIAFVKSQDAIVQTHGMKSWMAFINQRLRWAGKMNLVKDWKLKMIPAFIWLQRFTLLSLFITGIYLNSLSFVMISFSCFILQLLVEFILQLDACRFYKIKKWEIWFLPAALLHYFYFLLLGLLSWLPIKTEWKGRNL